MKGWISLHRSLLEWEWYTDNNTKSLFIHLLLRASHKDGKWRGIDCKKGDIITSRSGLSSETGLSEQQVRTALKKLESTGEITIKSTSKLTKISICNWEIYQDKERDSNQQNNQQITSKQPSSNQVATTYNNVNNNNNVNNELKATHDLTEKIASHWKDKFKGKVILDEAIKRKISKVTSQYSFDDIVETIDKYHEILTSEDYYYTKKLSLFDFVDDNEFSKWLHAEKDSFKKFEDKEQTKLKVGSKKQWKDKWLTVLDKEAFNKITWGTLPDGGFDMTDWCFYSVHVNGSVYKTQKVEGYYPHQKLSEAKTRKVGELVDGL